MTRYISILRGINVGGKRRILMSDLKRLFEDFGFIDITTYIQSGNVIFDCNVKKDNIELANKIEQSIMDSYEFKVPVIVRTINEIKQIKLNNPFLKIDTKIERLHLTFLNEIPNSDKLEKIKSYDFTPDKFEIINKDIYIFCSGKYSDSKLTNKFFENKLKITATTRNWNTVNKLYEIATNQ